MKTRVLCAIAAFMLLVPLSLSAQRPITSSPPTDGSMGHVVYEASCQTCHDGDGSERAPGMTALMQMTPRAIFAALTTGRMRREGEDLSEEQQVAVSEWLTGAELVETRMPSSAFCGSGPAGPGEVHWSGWGGGNGEAGFSGADRAGITAANVGELELAWAFAFPDATQMRSKPAVIGDRVLLGSNYGEVYSIDLEAGCAHWVFAAGAAVRGGIAIGEGPDGKQTAFFADFTGMAYAIDAATGEQLWSTPTAIHNDNNVTGTVAYHDGTVFVPLSSMEILTAGNPNYECCTSSGAIVALSAETGEPVWTFETVTEEPRHVGENEVGARRLGPSGAPIWSSPTVDAERGLLYVGTGENYTHPTTTTSDAIIALDLATGETRWSFQGTENDAWNMACAGTGSFENCPENTGPDFDFGMSPIIVTRDDGSQILVAGQKSGMVWAFDPDADGELIWAKKLGKGSALGGVHWGLSADGRRAYVPIVDNDFAIVRDVRTGEPAHESASEEAGSGLHAVDLGGGEVIWKVDMDMAGCAGKTGCQPFFSSASTTIDGAVLSGTLDGRMRAWSTEDGSLLWEVDTMQEFETSNGVPGRGGSIDGPGPVVAQGTVLILSGYDLFGARPGNVLLAYRPASPE